VYRALINNEEKRPGPYLGEGKERDTETPSKSKNMWQEPSALRVGGGRGESGCERKNGFLF